ncbi:MAG: hypothetical protein WA639_21045 [Candidatus Acidiferrum sp.]
MPPPRVTQSSSGRTPPRIFNAPPGWHPPHQDQSITNFRVPAAVTLSISIFRAKSATQGQLPALISKARELLQKYGFTLDVYPADGNPTVIDFDGTYKVSQTGDTDFEDAEATTIRQKAAEAFDDRANPVRLPVIMVNIEQNPKADSAVTGRTLVDFSSAAGDGRKTVNGATWLPYTLLDARASVSDAVTLLHEMGHGALLRHWNDDHDGIDLSDTMNIMFFPNSQGGLIRSTINKKQVRAFARCYYGNPKLRNF